MGHTVLCIYNIPDSLSWWFTLISISLLINALLKSICEQVSSSNSSNQLFYSTNRKRKFQRLPKVSVEMSRKGQNCPVSCLKKHINWKWWKVDSRWKQEWRRVHSTKLTTKLLLEEDCRGTTQWRKPLEEVCYLGNSIICTYRLSVRAGWDMSSMCHDREPNIFPFNPTKLDE